MHKKGQLSGLGMALIGLFLTLAVVGVLQAVTVLTVSKVTNNVDSQIPLEAVQAINETVNITMHVGADNSTLLAFDNVVADSESVANGTDSTEILTSGTDYILTESTGNFTLINLAYNITELQVTYQHNEDTDFHTTADTLTTSNLDSLELGGTAQIVLAATVIIFAVFGMVMVFRGRG